MVHPIMSLQNKKDFDKLQQAQQDSWSIYQWRKADGTGLVQPARETAFNSSLPIPTSRLLWGQSKAEMQNGRNNGNKLKQQHSN